MLLLFSETVGDELANLRHRLLRLDAGSLHLELGSIRAAQQEHAHHALGVCRLARAAEQNLARKTRSELHQLGRRTRVQAQLVPDFEGPPRLHHSFPPRRVRGGGSAWSGSAPRPFMLTRSISRCTTSNPIPSARPTSSARCSATATERWRPPVQPTAIVT